jgi:hypothetical protein
MAGKRKRSWKKIVLWVIGILVIIFAVIQAIPYGRTGHTNPPATNAFVWTDPQAETLAKASCYDCHSNETTWWWASKIAPFSWLIRADVDGGRSRFNFSEYAGRPSPGEFEEAVQGGMPPFQYTIAHPSAKLTDAEKQTLIKGYADSVAAMAGSSSGGSQSTGTTTGSDVAAIAAINQACGNCHSTTPALNYSAGSTAQAQALIDDMVKKGATLTAEQVQLLLQYFTR